MELRRRKMGMRFALIISTLAVAVSVMVFVPAHAEDGDIKALRWNCMALDTLLVGKSLGIPDTPAAAAGAADIAATKFAEQEHIEKGLARGRMRRAMAYFGGPVGVVNECIERGWYADSAK
jgi:hypothetical protein